MKFFLVSLYVYTGEDDNIRINTIYDLLAEKHDVTIITTDFNHRTKTKHNIIKSNRKIVFLKVPEYKKNIGFKRFYSHGIFALRLYSFLKSIDKKPDKIYCILPTSSSGYICYRYCKKNNIPLAIDIIDLWPESFVAIMPFSRLFSLITYPWKILSFFLYKNADLVFSESIEYAKYADKHRSKSKVLPVYLGADIDKYDQLINKSNININKPKDEIWIAYGGGLGNSYDFDVILDALLQLKKEGIENIKFWFIGGGIKQKYIENFIINNNLNVEITGFLPYHDYLKYLSLCDIAVNSFNKNTKVVHSYKFNDYILCGLAIVNNLKGETADFITKYNIGINFDYSDNNLFTVIRSLIFDIDRLNQMKKNSKYVAENILNKKLIYSKMIKLLES
jgi:hypothetical protein